MSVKSCDLVVAALRIPASVLALNPASSDLLVRQARSAELLARIAALLEADGLFDRVPEAPRAHLQSAATLASAQQDEVRREVAHVARALESLAIPVVLLKGAAYLLAELPAALGRTFADVDILVPKNRIGEVEAALMLAGWATTHHSEYDQRYYRRWSHELPPLQHIHRQTVLDVHHAILPDTARVKADSGKLLAAARPLPGAPGLHILAPNDMVLHSMAHLFQNEESGHGLRDLSDLDLLLRHFAVSAGFLEGLVMRARELGLIRPLYYGLHHVQRVWETPIGESTLSALAATPGAAPPRPLRGVMSALWSQALRPPHASAADRMTAAALFALYLRAHWMRMPTLHLLRHLAVKAATHHD